MDWLDYKLNERNNSRGIPTGTASGGFCYYQTTPDLIIIWLPGTNNRHFHLNQKQLPGRNKNQT